MCANTFGECGEMTLFYIQTAGKHLVVSFLTFRLCLQKNQQVKLENSPLHSLLKLIKLIFLKRA